MMGTIKAVAKSWQFKVCLCLALLGVLWYIVLQDRKKDPSYAVSTFFSCLESENGGCIASLTGELEGSMGAPTASQYKRFFEEIYRPAMSGFYPEGPPRYDDNIDREVMFSASRFYVHPDGRRIDVGATGYVTNERATVWPNFISVIFLVFQTYRKSGEEIGIDELWLRALNDLQPRLESIGITGAYFNDDFTGNFYTWDEWRNRLEARISEIRSQPASP